MDGVAPEVATIGNDGLVGTDAFMHIYSPTTRVIVQSAGWCYRVKPSVAQKLFDTEPEFRLLVLKYVHVIFSNS